MKLIKFDLPIDGVKVKTIEELREHFTIEILDHYRSGLLSKWLRCRGMDEKMTALALLDGLDEHALLKGICEIFSVEVDDLIISAMLDEPPQKIAQNITENTQAYDDLAETIDSSIYKAIRLNCITTGADGTLQWDTINKSELDQKDNWSPFIKGNTVLTCQPNYATAVQTIAPGLGKLISPIIENYLAEKGDIAGWMLLSEHAEDYSGNWGNFSAILIQRKNMLFSAAQKVCIPLLKTAIEKRVDKLQTIIETLAEANKDSTQFESLLALPLNQRHMIFFKRVEKFIEVKLINDDYFFGKCKLNKLFVKQGDKVFINDPIAELKSIYAGRDLRTIRSTASGIVREVLHLNDKTLSFGDVLIKVEPLDYLNSSN